MRTLFIAAVLLCFVTTISAQKPRFTPQVHELGIHLGETVYVPELADYYSQRANPPFYVVNGLTYTYHPNILDAVRARLVWRRTDFEVPAGIDRFSMYEAEKEDIMLNLGYARKLNMGVLQLYAGFQATYIRGKVSDAGILSQTGDPFSGRYFYSDLGGGLFAGAKVFMSKHLSLGLEAQGFYLKRRYQATPENTFYLFSEQEVGFNALASVNIHLLKMAKKCTCPRHKR